MVGQSQLHIVNQDFMESFNRYPDQKKKVSIIQYDPVRLSYNIKRGKTYYTSQRDIFNQEVHRQSTFANEAVHRSFNSENGVKYNTMIDDLDLKLTSVYVSDSLDSQ